MRHPFYSRMSAAVLALLVVSCGSGRDEARAQTSPEGGHTPMGTTENTIMNDYKTMNINITVGGKTFTAEIEDSETGRAFVSRLPLTLSMSELNGNEKYYYLDEALPSSPRHYDVINAGDLMLYGSECVVIFYGKAGGYSYTRIGKLTDTDGLAEALGRGSASVTFSSAVTGIRQTSVPDSVKGRIHAMNGAELDAEPAAGMYIRDGKKFSK